MATTCSREVKETGSGQALVNQGCGWLKVLECASQRHTLPSDLMAVLVVHQSETAIQSSSVPTLVGGICFSPEAVCFQPHCHKVPSDFNALKCSPPAEMHSH